ncbi:MAG: 50S ribosomal protein L21 [bacterium]
MFAVLKSGGKQYKVSKGDTIQVEKLAGEVGDEVELSSILMVVDDENNVQVGRPLVDGASVKAEIVGQDRLPKIIVFKMKRRKNYRRKAGHRQPFTALKIVDIAS